MRCAPHGPPHPVLTLARLGPTPARKLCVSALEGQDRGTVFPQEFEIELEGSQSLRILCYEKCYDKTKVNKDNNEIVDKIMGKGQIQVSLRGVPQGGGSPLLETASYSSSRSPRVPASSGFTLAQVHHVHPRVVGGAPTLIVTSPL